MHRPRTTAKQRLGRVRSASGAAAALLVAGAALATLQCDATPPTDLPNVLLITVDTLRADHLETYGYPRRTDPALRGLAMEGIVFDRARAQAPWTLPSMASLFTGLYPSEHGAIFADLRIRSGDVGLAEVMHEAGYRTVAVVSHDFVDSSRGFARGFERFDESQIRPEDAVTSMQITDAALRHLRDRPDERPTFLWTHYFDPHFSSVRHPEYGFADDYRGPLGKVLPVDLLNERADAAQRGGVPMASADVRYAIDVYDEEIAFTDGAIGALLDAARGFDPQRPLLVVFTADHGELFMEHGPSATTGSSTVRSPTSLWYSEATRSRRRCVGCVSWMPSRPASSPTPSRRRGVGPAASTAPISSPSPRGRATTMASR